MFKQILITTLLLSSSIFIHTNITNADTAPSGVKIINEQACSIEVEPTNLRFSFTSPVKSSTCQAVALKIGSRNTVVLDPSNEDKRVSLDAAPFIKNGSTLVPVRFVSEGLGADVKWNGDTQEVTIISNSNTLILKIGSSEAKLNGESITMPVSPEIINGSTFVPLRFISESLNAKVYWNGDYQLIGIKKDL
jgi:hypothetical protein